MKRLLALVAALVSLAAGPALAYPIATVGSQITTQTAVQTVTASSAYTSGNAVGGLMTLPSATASNGNGSTSPSATLQSVLMYTKSAQAVSTDVFLFSANPSASTCTDKTAFSLAAADFDKVVGVAHINDWTSGGTPSIGQSQNLALPVVLASGTAMYACAVTRGTPTYTSTSDVELAYRLYQNQ